MSKPTAYGDRAAACAGLAFALAASLCAQAGSVSRQAYNEGTERLRQGKWRDAEASLQAAVASNDDRVQPAALYNLGLVRFRQGAEALKDAPDAGAARNRADTAGARTDAAIVAADQALAGNDLEAITRAYLQGKGARKELKAAMEAVKKAMEAHGAVLARWMRASGDFKSAAELKPALESARFNAQVVDENIAALVDKKEMLTMAMQCMNGQRQNLKQKMDELKKRMPDGQQEKGEGDEDEEEEEGDKPPEPKPGQQEPEHREGKPVGLTWEEAIRLLEALKLDGNRKLPMGDHESGKAKDRRGKDW